MSIQREFLKDAWTFTYIHRSRANELPPIAIPSITGTLLGSFSKGMSKMFDGIMNPFASSAGSGGPTTPGASEDVTFELGGGPDKLQGSRAERR